MKPTSSKKNAIDFDSSSTARMIHNLRKIGVRFQKEKPFFVKVGYGHISLKIDGIIDSGIPDFPNDSGLLFVRRLGKSEFEEVKSSGVPESLQDEAHLLMAIGGFKKSFFFSINSFSGDIIFSSIDVNFRIAESIQDITNFSVSSNRIPVRYDGWQLKIGDKDVISSKCQKCEFGKFCLLPETPAPSCRTCAHFVIGDSGFAACGAKSNYQLTVEEQQNLNKCEMHIYNPDFLESWASLSGLKKEKDKNLYVNKTNGQEFINGNDPISYSSYEIFETKGMELIGDKKIDAIRKMFSASIQED